MRTSTLFYIFCLVVGVAPLLAKVTKPVVKDKGQVDEDKDKDKDKDQGKVGKDNGKDSEPPKFIAPKQSEFPHHDGVANPSFDVKAALRSAPTWPHGQKPGPLEPIGYYVYYPFTLHQEKTKMLCSAI
ncbi:hypothetical protein F5148DRAFT_1176682 [Russula earlei]|uniref:Uncharacterized protein n=1 Tax=Russula earlei TaxID=71964 RepID=A0ACC0UGM9_9AGAM|nr:hypothetical protein F5148DRAFT_1176682 [Russula earlei]